jgi:predicted phage-related endonuclease
LSNFSTPLDVWMRKTGALDEQESSPRMDAGNRFESVICDWYADLEGVQLQTSDTIYHPTERWISCTPDRLVVGPDGVFQRAVQCKTVGVNMYHAWGGDGFVDNKWWRLTHDGVPKAERIQVEWELVILHALYGLEETDLVAMTGTDLRVYRIRRDPELAAALIAGARQFWSYVERDEPPPVDGSESWRRYLEARFPRPERIELDPITEEAEAAARRYIKAREIEDKAERAKAKAANELCDLVADGAGFIGGGIKVTWNANKNGKRTLLVKEIG